MKKTMDVWIELQKPDEQYTAEEICDNANKMLNKLGISHKAFIPNKGRKYGVDYIHQQGNDGSFTYMEDNGHWFNLEYLAKENEKC
jgi:hypothetical protein|tara:strand:+ start:1585 stop:1842 length:258 start_codon:yes stop_codon:yes gene_type:complete